MDLTLNADQRDLQSGLRAYLADVWTADRLRTAADDPALDRKAWRGLAEMGVFGLTVPESGGGMGLGLADAAIVFEELGRALVPGPLVATFLAAGLVPGAEDGGAVVTVIDTAEPIPIVEHLPSATHVVVVTDDGLFLLPADALDATPAAIPLDPLTPVSQVTVPRSPVFQDTVAQGTASQDTASQDTVSESAVPQDGVPQGTVGSGEYARAERVGSAEDAARWRLHGAALTAALQVGVAQGGLDLAVRYAKERTQFDRVIGSFQAVKHLLAESLVRVDLARAAVLVAALTIDDPRAGDPDEAVSAAKFLADDAATAGGRTCVQVHGGMGFTWEVLAHLYLKRAWLLETCFGRSDEHAMRLATILARNTEEKS